MAGGFVHIKKPPGQAAVSATIQPEIDEVAQIVKNYAEEILGRMIDTRNVA